MANPPQNPKEQHTDEPNGRKGADTLVEGEQRQFGAMLLDTVGLKSTFSFPHCTETFHLLLHACLFHAEGDLGVLVAEQYVCDARGWVARGV